MTPFELWFGWKPSLQHLRACVCELQTGDSGTTEGDEDPESEPSKQHRGKEVPTARSRPMTLRHHTKEGGEDFISSKMELIDCGGITGSKKIENDPSSYQEATRKLAAIEEMESLRKHNVWELGELPKDAIPISCRWVLHKKTNASGEVTR
ncbi:hypothetical protein LAZ67_3005789 [Cordylochernes scorpioides]|uniref:Reverse transcriptase Ty1/copia-type domain-containing protein n=1 Tax=Cordylochernes scorpioides TaxID=51811 RepID=A0ABY6KDQ1_9ARAC|nr:hypothetical protein LAZ67_3005789 [Cordylochernes scorpioides]